MAARVTYPAQPNALLAIPFAYIDRSHVVVKRRTVEAGLNQVVFSGITLKEGTDYIFNSASQLQLTSNPAGLYDFLVERDTPEVALVRQQPGNLSSAKVNLADTQSLYRAEEVDARITDFGARMDFLVQNPPESFRGDPGPQGPQGYSVVNLAQLKAAPVTDGPLSYDQAVFAWYTDQDYSGLWDDVNFIRSTLVGGTGAWVRQKVDTIMVKRSADAVPLSLKTRLGFEVWLEEFGFSPANTAAANLACVYKAIAALPADGGWLRFGHGTFKTNPIRLPVDPKVVSIWGSGEASVLELGIAQGPVIRRDGELFSDGRILGATIGNFTVKAHAASDRTNLAHMGINFTGFGKSLFADITYASNGAGALGVLLSADSKNGATYNNVIERITAYLQTGPSRVVRLHNDGGGSTANPNLTEIRDSWFYGCSNVAILLDCFDSTRTRVDNCLFEDCAGATGLSLGQNTVVTGNWFELLNTNIITSAAASVDGSGSTIIGNYFSGAGTSFIDTIGVKPLWIGNAGGGQTVTGQGVTKIQGATAAPAGPTLARTGGVTGDPSVAVAPAVIIAKDAVGEVTFSMRHAITPASASFQLLKLTPPAGYQIKAWDLGAVRNANGLPCAVGPGDSIDQKYVSYLGADAHTVNSYVTLKEVL